MIHKLLVAALCLAALAVPAIASTDPVADTRQIMAGTVTTLSTKKAYLSGARDGTAAFQGALAAYKGVRAAEAPPPPPAPIVVTSRQLLDFAAQVEAATAPSAAIDLQAVALLQPTIFAAEGRMIATSGVAYSADASAVLRDLKPASWLVWPSPDPNALSVTLVYYSPAVATVGSGWEKYETFALKPATRPLSALAATARAWAWILQQQGR
jgi:hypothetical protein